MIKLQENAPALLDDYNIEWLTQALQVFLGGEIVTFSGSDGRYLINNVEQCGDSILINFFDGDTSKSRTIKPGDIITKISRKMLTIRNVDGDVLFTRLYANSYED